MTLSQVTAEAAPDGTAITTANGATYGFSTVSLGGGTITAKSAAALDGSRGFEVASAASGTTLARVSLASANQQAAVSVAFKLVTAASTGSVQTVGIRYASGYCVRLNWGPPTELWVNDNDITALGSGYGSAATGTAYRLEVVANTGASGTAGSATVNLYLLGGTTPVNSWTISGGNLHGPDAISDVEIAASNGAVIYYDSIQSNDGGTTEIGRIATVHTPPTEIINDRTLYVIDRHASTGTGTSLSYAIAQTGGTTTAATLLAPGVWGVVQPASGTLTYQVTVTTVGGADDGQTATDTVNVPAAASSTPVRTMLQWVPGNPGTWQ